LSGVEFELGLVAAIRLCLPEVDSYESRETGPWRAGYFCRVRVSAAPGGLFRLIVINREADSLVCAAHNRIERHRRPFEFLLLAPVLQADFAAGLIDRLDNLSWQRTMGSFFCFDSPRMSSDYLNFHQALVSAQEIGLVLRAVSEMSDSPLELSTVDLHRYDHGNGIGAHTDSGAKELRFVLNLNRGWDLSYGGVLIFSGASDLSRQTRYIAPIHNTGFGFRPAIRTYHALSPSYSPHSRDSLTGMVQTAGIA